MRSTDWETLEAIRRFNVARALMVQDRTGNIVLARRDNTSLGRLCVHFGPPARHGPSEAALFIPVFVGSFCLQLVVLHAHGLGLPFGQSSAFASFGLRRAWHLCEIGKFIIGEHSKKVMLASYTADRFCDRMM